MEIETWRFFRIEIGMTMDFRVRKCRTTNILKKSETVTIKPPPPYDVHYVVSGGRLTTESEVLRKHSLFDKTKPFVSKEEAGLLISFTTLNKVND